MRMIRSRSPGSFHGAMTTDSVEAATLASVIDRLHASFTTITVDTIAQTVAEAHAGYDGSRIREFVPLLVERDSRERLRALLPTPAAPTVEPPGDLRGTARG